MRKNRNKLKIKPQKCHKMKMALKNLKSRLNQIKLKLPQISERTDNWEKEEEDQLPPKKNTYMSIERRMKKKPKNLDKSTLRLCKLSLTSQSEKESSKFLKKNTRSSKIRSPRLIYLKTIEDCNWSDLIVFLMIETLNILINFNLIFNLIIKDTTRLNLCGIF